MPCYGYYLSAVSGGQCATTDQLESMLGYIQQGIINSSSDGMATLVQRDAITANTASSPFHYLAYMKIIELQ